MTKNHDDDVLTYAAEQIRSTLRESDCVCRTCLGQGFFGRIPHEVECATCNGTGRAGQVLVFSSSVASHGGSTRRGVTPVR